MDRLVLGTLIGSLALLAPAPAAAQDPAQEPEAQRAEVRGIEEITVTARKREEDIQSVPIPVTAMTADQLTDRSITEVKDLERVTPNLSFQDSGVAKNTSQVFLRGVGQINWGPTQDPKVGVYLDGIYLGRPQGGVFDLFDVDRVEVLRGPQGTLFGKNTPAGLVHVITKRPEFEFGAKVKVGAGNDGQFTSAGMVNLPIIDETLAARFSFQTNQADGWVTNRSKRGLDMGRDRSQSAKGSLLWTPDDSTDVLLNVDWTRSRETAMLGQCIWSGVGGLAFVASIFGIADDLERECNEGGDKFRASDNDPSDNKLNSWGVSATLTRDLGFAELTLITGWRRNDWNNESWGWGSDASPGVALIEVLDWGWSRHEQWSHELRLAGTAFEDKLDYVVGFYWFEESSNLVTDVPLYRGVSAPPDDGSTIFYVDIDGDPETPGTFGDIALATQRFGSRKQNFEARNVSWAPFFETTYHLTDRLSLTTGLRFTSDYRWFKRVQRLSPDNAFDPGYFCPGMPLSDGTVVPDSGLAPPPGVTSLAPSCKETERFGGWTPRAIAHYEVSDEVLVYGGWSRGLASGGMNGDTRMRRFEPEISSNWEGGIKSTWFDGRLLANVTFFYNDYEQYQVTVGRLVNGQPTADLINAQKAVMKGWELEMLAVPFDGLQLSFTAGRIDADFTEFSTVDNVVEIDPDTGVETDFQVVNDFADSDFIYTPPYTYAVGASYTLPLATRGDLTFRADWSVRAHDYATLENLHTSKQHKYGLLSARIAWDLADGKTQLALWGTNLLDREYFTNAINVASVASLRGMAPPRRYGLEVRREFGY